MNLSEMRTLVRRDLHDEDSENYRWTDNELDRHIAHGVREFSEYLPYQQKTAQSTVSGSREMDISGLTGRIMVEAIEYPTDQFLVRYQPFSLWGDIVTLLGEEVPDGSDANLYYGKLHTLDGSGSTIPARYEDLIVTGAWRVRRRGMGYLRDQPGERRRHRYTRGTARMGKRSTRDFPTGNKKTGQKKQGQNELPLPPGIARRIEIKGFRPMK